MSAEPQFRGATARGRVYKRRFDYDEALRLSRDGLAVREIAERLGVTAEAIRRVLRPEQTAEVEARAEAKRRERFKCEDCGRQMTHNICRAGDFRLLCVACRGKARRTRFSTVRGVIYARCVTCQESKPVDEFPGGTAYRDIRPKGVAGQCRGCQTVARREYRAAHREADRAYNREYRRRRRSSSRPETAGVRPLPDATQKLSPRRQHIPECPA